MKRDELVTHLAALPADTDVGVRLGNAELDISEVTVSVEGTAAAFEFDGEGAGTFAVLACDERDFRDVLTEWGIPAHRRDELVKKTA
jgi:hypothetical protein